MVPDELIAGHLNSEDEYALTEFQIELLRAVTRAEAMKSPQTSDSRDLRTLLKMGYVTTKGPPWGYTLTDMGLNELGRMAEKS